MTNCCVCRLNITLLDTGGAVRACVPIPLAICLNELGHTGAAPVASVLGLWLKKRTNRRWTQSLYTHTHTSQNTHTHKYYDQAKCQFLKLCCSTIQWATHGCQYNKFSPASNCHPPSTSIHFATRRSHCNTSTNLEFSFRTAGRSADRQTDRQTDAQFRPQDMQWCRDWSVVCLMPLLCYCSAVTVLFIVLSPCYYYAICVLLPCYHCAITVLSLCYYYAISVHLLRYHCAIIMLYLCYYYAITVLSLCYHCAITVLSLCYHCAITVLSLCYHCAITVLSLCYHCAITALSLCYHCVITAITVLSLCYHCAITVLLLCYHCAFTVLSLCYHFAITVPFYRAMSASLNTDGQ
jgi:hypothetical protein